MNTDPTARGDSSVDGIRLVCRLRRRFRSMSSLPPAPASASTAPPHAFPAPWLDELGWKNRFELLERIGSGAMGQVWRAREKTTGRVVALKVIDPSRFGDEHLLARLDIEASTLVRLREEGRHECIVPIIDFAVTDSCAALVMEFIPGMTLGRWCESQRLDLTARVALVATAARATGWFHRLGVIHRDLKPANILVSALTHEPVIVDFSIAKANDSLPLTLTHEAIGTAPYMAPEQFDSSLGGIGPSMDVHALGAVLYELMTHVLPHPGDSAQIMRRHLKRTPPVKPSLLNRDIPADLDSVILKALAHRAGDRYANGTELSDDLDRFLAGKPVVARPISRIIQVVRQARRRPGLTLSIATSIGLAALSVWAWRIAEDNKMLREIEASLNDLKNGKQWAKPQLQTAERLLADLARFQPARAQVRVGEITTDVIHDVDEAIARSFSRPDECRWITDDVIEWIRGKDPAYANALRSRVEARAKTWTVKAIVRPPFTDMGELFPQKDVRSAGLTLIPAKFDANGRATVVFSHRMKVPAEVSANFTPDAARFPAVVIHLKQNGRSMSARLEQGWSMPPDVSRLIREPTAVAPEDYVLTGLLDGVPQAAQILKRPNVFGGSMSGQSFALNVRWGEGRLLANLNGSRVVELAGVGFSPTKDATCEFEMPSGLGIREITLRKQETAPDTLNTSADRAMAEGRWSIAAKLWEEHVHLQIGGDEAPCKLALCQWVQGEKARAFDLWQALAAKTGPWAEHSAFRLWYHTALDHGVEAAAGYLHRIPGDGAPQPPANIRDINLSERERMEELYSLSVSHVDGIRLSPEAARDALKALRILGTPSHVIAARLALPLHHHGLDALAAPLLRASLRVAGGPNPSVVAPELLDHWSRIESGAPTTALLQALNQYRNGPVSSATGSRVLRASAWHERARELARSSDWQDALCTIDANAIDQKTSAPVFASQLLLRGALLKRLGKNDDANAAWRAALSPLYPGGVICPLAARLDQIMLRTATRSWDRESAIALLLANCGEPGTGKRTASHLHDSAASLLTDAAVIHVLNELANQAGVSQIIEDSAFRVTTSRESLHRWTLAALERALLAQAFPSTSPQKAKSRVSETVPQFSQIAMMTEESGEAWNAFFRHWVELPAQPDLPEIQARSAELETRLRWLLAQRYRLFGKEDPAEIIEASLKSHPAFPKDWLAE